MKHEKESSDNLFVHHFKNVCSLISFSLEAVSIENHNILQKKSHLVRKGLGTV